jgi:hypothetical protein
MTSISVYTKKAKNKYAQDQEKGLRFCHCALCRFLLDGLGLPKLCLSENPRQINRSLQPEHFIVDIHSSITINYMFAFNPNFQASAGISKIPTTTGISICSLS